MKMLDMEFEAEVAEALDGLQSYERSELERACGAITDFLLKLGIVSDDVLNLQGLIKVVERNKAEAVREAAKP